MRTVFATAIGLILYQSGSARVEKIRLLSKVLKPLSTLIFD